MWGANNLVFKQIYTDILFLWTVLIRTLFRAYNQNNTNKAISTVEKKTFSVRSGTVLVKKMKIYFFYSSTKCPELVQ